MHIRLSRCRSNSFAGPDMALETAAYRYAGAALCRRGNAAGRTAAGGSAQSLPRLAVLHGHRQGAGARLTVVMTFVINLAVPPLLFAQVLYGRALYTSSVLIGLYWISIIGLLMLAYWLLYQFSARLEAGKSAWWVGPERVAAGRLHRPPALHQYDADAAPRGLAGCTPLRPWALICPGTTPR
jgi:hypothetical protein